MPFKVPLRIPKRKMYPSVSTSGSSGLFLEMNNRDVVCHHCGKNVFTTFLVTRYRGTQAACQNLLYHKDCLLEMLTRTPPLTKKSTATCLICGQKQTDWKFRHPRIDSKYNYGGYHHACVQKFIEDNTEEYKKLQAIEYDEVQRRAAIKNKKLLKDEEERVMLKSW